jgi:OOP family OmpA-OmpF porin
MLKTIQLDPDSKAAVTTSSATADLEEVRRILLSKDQAEIQELKTRLDELKPLTAQTLGEHLPDGVVQRTQTDDRLTKSMVPVVEESIRASIQMNRTKLADILFPVIGPAIRKAITEALRSLLEPQSVQNQYRSFFSVQGMKWRLESLRTGRTFNEVLLSHTLLYRVEQVFLIHRESGLLLHHLVAEGVPTQDADLVSGMLTAIKSFVMDSFGTSEHEGLETLEIGEMTILVEEGPKAVLAGVVRGSAPNDLRLIFKESLENIHFEQQVAFANFKGDSSPFLATTPHLDRCLQASYKTDENSVSSSHWLQLGMKALFLALLFGIPLFFIVRDSWRWNQTVKQVQQESGFVITDASKDWFTAFGWGKYHLSGMKDPLATDPKQILAAHHLDSRLLDASLHPYQALEPAILTKRLKRILNPSQFTTLDVNAAGILVPQGIASDQWKTYAKTIAPAISGLNGIDFSKLLTSKEYIQTVLTPKLNAQQISFEVGKADVSPEALKPVAEIIQQVNEVAQMGQTDAHVGIYGYADNTGDVNTNLNLSKQRAENVKTLLVRHFNIPDAFLNTIGDGILSDGTKTEQRIAVFKVGL